MAYKQALYKLAEQADLALTAYSDTHYSCDFTFDDGRSQKAIFTVIKDSNYDIVILFSAVVSMKIVDLPTSTMSRLLSYGRAAPVGSFALTNLSAMYANQMMSNMGAQSVAAPNSIEMGGVYMLSFMQRHPLFGLTPELFRSLAHSIARTADRWELELTGKDDY